MKSKWVDLLRLAYYWLTLPTEHRNHLFLIATNTQRHAKHFIFAKLLVAENVKMYFYAWKTGVKNINRRIKFLDIILIGTAIFTITPILANFTLWDLEQIPQLVRTSLLMYIIGMCMWLFTYQRLTLSISLINPNECIERLNSFENISPDLIIESISSDADNSTD